MRDECLIKDSIRMYGFTRANGDEYVLNVVCGGMAMFEAKIVLSSEEVRSFQLEGKAFIDLLAMDVSKNTSAYVHRMI